MPDAHLPRLLCSEAKSQDLVSTNQMHSQYTLTWAILTKQPRSGSTLTLSLLLATSVMVKARSSSQRNSQGANCRLSAWWLTAVGPSLLEQLSSMMLEIVSGNFTSNFIQTSLPLWVTQNPMNKVIFWLNWAGTFVLLIIRNTIYYICIAVKYHVKISDVADALVASPTNTPYSSLLAKWIFDPISTKLI